MKKDRSIKLLASAVVATLSVIGFANSAHAQYRVGEDGHANDANNRIGSGGYNGARTNYPNQYGNASNILNNQVNGQIITGNVTGLNYFHGASNEFDPNVVQANIGTRNTDRFLAISESSNMQERSTGAPRATAYYSSDKLVAPPDNFVTTPNGQGVVPSTAIKNAPNDTRLGDINVGTSNVLLPTPGELDLPGPLDSSGNASSLIASPLYGMRQFNPNDAGDAYFLSRYSNVQPTGPVQAARANNVQLQQMRDELNSTMVPNTADTAKSGNASTGITPANANLNQSQQINGSSALPSNAPLSNQALTSNLNDQPLNGNPNPALGTRQQFTDLIKPEQQSAQLRDMVDRMSRLKQQTPEQSAESFNELRQLNATEKKAIDDKASALAAAANAAPETTPPPGGVTPPDTLVAGGNPGGALKPEEPVTAAPMNPMLSGPITGNDKPYVITSLATGIKAKGLADLLTSAELQMRQGKFSAALDTYDRAREVAPNNPFAVLGRAFAELGEATYGRAEADLRRSFMAESGVVLIGQYDLRGFLGEDRLKFVVKDLKDLNSKEKNERSAFLLAFIAHNVGDDESAAKLLDDAEQRGGGNDSVIQLMRQNWQLKSAAVK